MKNKRKFIAHILAFLILFFSTNVYADEKVVKSNNEDVVKLQQDYTDKKIDELSKKIYDKIEDQQKRNDNLTDILKTNLEESNQKNNYLLSFFQTVIAIITFIFSAAMIVAGVMGVNIRKSIKNVKTIESDLKKKQEDIEQKHNDVSNDLKKAQEDLLLFETFSKTIEEQVNAIDNVKVNLVGTIKDIGEAFDQVREAITSFKENGNVDELDANLQTAVAQVEEVINKEKDSNEAYIEKCEQRVNSIMEFKVEE